MTRKYLQIFGLFLVALLALVGCGGAKPQAPAPGSPAPSAPAAPAGPAAPGEIKIGAALSQSGAQANAGQYVKKGYDLWADHVNKRGGIPVGDKQYLVKMIYYDDKSDATTVAKLVEKLITEDKVDFLFGPYGSGLSGAASSISEKYRKLMIAPAANADSLYTRGYKYFFGVLPPLSQGFGLQANLLANLEPKPKTVAILTPDDLFATFAAEAAEKRAKEEGLEVVYFKKYPKGAKDISAMLTEVKGLNPDAVLVPGYFEDTTLLVRQSQQLNFNPRYVGVQAAPGLTETLKKEADYLYISQWWVPEAGWKDSYFGTSREYNELFKKTYGAEANYFAAVGSAAGQILDLALQEAKSLDSAKVAEAIRFMNIMTFFGPVEYHPTGYNRSGSGVVTQIQNGKEVVVWPKSQAAAKTQFPMPPWNQR